MSAWIAYGLAASIGAALGLSEILSRYTDAPGQAALSRAGCLYIAFNGAMSLAALYMIREVFPIAEPVNAAPPTDIRTLVSQGLIAGLGAMAILRSSFFTARVGGKDVEIGPAAVIEIFRRTMDRDVARARALPRAESALEIMRDVSFVRSYEALSSISMSLLQNVSAEERASIEQQVGALANRTGRTDQDKALELGLLLAGVAGFPALRAAKATLGEHATNSKSRPALVAEQVARLDLNAILRDLPSVCLAMNLDVPTAEQEALSKQIDAVAASALSPNAKRINAGLLIVNAVGEEDFRAAIDLLAGDPPPAPNDPVI